MRWNNLSMETDERSRLPGYRDGAVVRHFEAPGSIKTRFYEVRAKSILNAVPPASQMPFRWTINPYRGCSHACVYCMAGDSRILMADARTKPLRDVEIGEEIYGTRLEGSHRRFVTTRVLDKWSSIKPAFAIELEDGTELIAGDEHRFLTRRGWKHVIGAEQGRFRRPHLTVGTRLLGPGGCVTPPEVDADYRRGYLCGMIRGDGNLASDEYQRVGRSSGMEFRFRLAPADTEALDRAREFLRLGSVATSEFSFQAAVGGRRAVTAIRTQSRANDERMEELIAWPILPTLAWIKGFLAGIFDAEGGCSGGILRISNKSQEIIDRIVCCARRLGFDCVVEPRANGVMTVRLRGGIAERMRFCLSTDPAITRKRSIEGSALKADSPLNVVAVKPLGMVMRMYDITTGTEDFVADGVISHNCFARPTHTYLGFDAGRDFEREIVVKVNAPEVLRAELARPSWSGEHVALGTNTDPYQWAEGRYRLMPGIWEVMRDAANPCSVLTKSPLLLRDLSLMQEIAARTEFSAALSVPTLDERAWRATEPHTPNPRARLEAVAELTRAGIPTGVLIAPLMPGINDAPEQIEPILALAAEAGASYVTGLALHLRGGVREVFFEWLREQRPELVERYEKLYRRGAYAPTDERKRLARLVKGPDLSPYERMRGRVIERTSTKPAPRELPQERLF